ncbi:hypothetical protein JCM3774_001256 [Rhodotorula dairenensis]
MLLRRTLARAASSSAARTAALAANQPHPHPPAPPPPAPAPSPSPSPAPARKPQPFIPRTTPGARKYQIHSVEAAPAVDPASASTIISFVEPAAAAPTSSTTAPVRTVTVPNLWLRDASVHPDHVHPSSNQRLFRTTDIPLTGKLIGYGVHDLPTHGECLVTEWSKPLDGHTDPTAAKLSVVPTRLLVNLLEHPQHPLEGDLTLPAPRTWDRSALEETLVRMPYDRFRSDDHALLETLDALVKDGIVFLTGVPTTERQGHHTELRRAVERIGSLRRTWYGDLWDVKAVEGSLNIAYTNLDLGLHMDLTHFDNPPRYQFLHSLQNAGVRGGQSYFVDTYAVAAHLHSTSPAAFSTLAHERVHFEYRNGDHHTRFVRPTFELENGSRTRLHAVNYSPPFQGPLPLERVSHSSTTDRTAVSADADATRLADLHDALAQFSHLCDDPTSRFRFEHQLEPGECVVFDNRRVLHARTAFEFERRRPEQQPPAAAEEGQEVREVGRWLKGAYMDGDEVWSKWRVLSRKSRDAQDEAQQRRNSRGRTLFV